MPTTATAAPPNFSLNWHSSNECMRKIILLHIEHSFVKRINRRLARTAWIYCLPISFFPSSSLVHIADANERYVVCFFHLSSVAIDCLRMKKKKSTHTHCIYTIMLSIRIDRSFSRMISSFSFPFALRPVEVPHEWCSKNEWMPSQTPPSLFSLLPLSDLLRHVCMNQQNKSNNKRRLVPHLNLMGGFWLFAFFLRVVLFSLFIYFLCIYLNIVLEHFGISCWNNEFKSAWAVLLFPILFQCSMFSCFHQPVRERTARNPFHLKFLCRRQHKKIQLNQKWEPRRW